MTKAMTAEELADLDHPRVLEFCCDVCLHAVYAHDTAAWPRCPRGHGKLTPDLGEPHPKNGPVARPRARPGGMRKLDKLDGLKKAGRRVALAQARG